MRDELYRELVDVVTMIRRGSADSSPTPEAPFAEWHLWARGFCAGLYCRRTAGRVAESVWQYALRTDPMPMLAYAAASAAWAVVNAAEGDEMAARLAARAARTAMVSLARKPARRAGAAPSTCASRSLSRSVR